MTAPKLRDYQVNAINGAIAEWNAGHMNVMIVLPTGGGKTVVLSYLVANTPGAVCVSAHRSELVTQISTALARDGVRHRVIGPSSLAKACAAIHMEEFGRSFIDPSSRVAVASVDTLRSHDKNDPWLKQVTLWVMDEGHHVLAENKWGQACALFPNARGLAVTATPVRADGKGLGRHADGLLDALVVGPNPRELIDRGYLTEYRIFAPPSDLDLSTVDVTASGDYSPPKLKAARQKSHITGDVVAHYLRIAPGKLGVTFDVDIESATQTAAAFKAAGVPAEAVSSKTPEALRRDILRRFKRREILQLVNVDLFGEGFDLPAIEVVSFARPTMSFSLFCQQFGRALRLLDGKQFAYIIDHVGNCMRHGLPDAARVWSLNRREKRASSGAKDAIPLRTCLNPTCFGVYERLLKVCPYCGHEHVAADRSAPEVVDGDLHELSPEVLARMRGAVDRIDGAPTIPYGASPEVAGSVKRRHWERQQAQVELRKTIALWGGWKARDGHDDSGQMKLFFWKFGIDTLNAMALGAPDAQNLTARIAADLATENVIEATK